MTNWPTVTQCKIKSYFYQSIAYVAKNEIKSQTWISNVFKSQWQLCDATYRHDSREHVRASVLIKHYVASIKRQNKTWWIMITCRVCIHTSVCVYRLRACTWLQNSLSPRLRAIKAESRSDPTYPMSKLLDWKHWIGTATHRPKRPPQRIRLAAIKCYCLKIDPISQGRL